MAENVNQNIIALTQVRLLSTRLPRKILLPLNGSETVLSLHIKRILQSKKIHKLIVLTTFEDGIDAVLNICQNLNVSFYQGSTDNVLERFYKGAMNTEGTHFLRLTSDCPLIDPQKIDDLVTAFLKTTADYGSNCLRPTLPDGFDAEIFTRDALIQCYRNAKTPKEIEHVTPWMRESGRLQVYSHEEGAESFSSLRMTLDRPEDYDVIKMLVNKVGNFGSMNEYIQCLTNDPDLIELKKTNEMFQRNENYEIISSPKKLSIKREFP